MPGQPWLVGDEAYRRVGGTGYDFIMKNVGAWASGWFNGEIDGVRSPAPFTLCGLWPGQKVDLYASAGWDGNYAGACIVFGDSGSAGVQAQTVGNPGANPSLDNFTFIGTATADARGEVSGAMKRGNTRSNKEGQSNGFWFVIHPVPSPDGGYTQWIAGHAPDSPGIARDADGDGKSNGLEYILGTDPAAADSGGLLAGEMTAGPDGSSFTFTHPLSESIPGVVELPYVWSTDLETFHANGASDGHCTVKITCQNNSGTATATATVTGGETPGRLFLRLDANSGWFDQVRGIGGSSDFDGDGLDNALERSIGSNPLLPDSSGDGMDDGWKHRHGLDVLARDPAHDADGDALPDLLEYLRGSDPREADENGDGRPDGAPVPGQVAMEQWTIPYAHFSDITYIENGPPEAVTWLDSLSHDAGMVDNSHPFGRRIRGYLTPPASGEYRFWVYGDDYAEFWLSADASTARIQRIAFNHWWNFREDYQQYPGQSSFPRQLEAGENYYFEIFHQGDETNDYFGVAWQHGSMPEPEIIGSQAIRSFVYDPADLDGDTLDDAFEKTAGLDPLDGPPFDGRFDDPDADTFENAWEARNGLNPLQANPYPARSRADLFPGLDDPGARSLEGWYRKTEGRHHQTEAFSHDTAVYLAASGTHADEYLFAYRSARQPFRLTAKIAYTAMDDTRAEAGLLVRGTLNEVAPAYRLSLAPDGRVQSRTKLQGDTPEHTRENGLLTFETAIWLRLEWDGRHITAHYSDDGQRWIEHEQRAIDLGDSFHFGFALTSHDPLEVVAAAFTDYRIDYDSDNDGLWNSEEAALGTRADAADTDGDGTSDFEEVTRLGTDPLVAEGFVPGSPVADLAGSAATPQAGAWRTEGDSLYAMDYRGALEFNLNIPEGGHYRLEIDLREASAYREASRFELDAALSGVSLGSRRTSASNAESSTLVYWLPWTAAGQKTLLLDWINVEAGSALQIDRVELIPLEFESEAELRQWTAGRLEDEFRAVADLASATSPYNLYGTARDLALLTIEANSDDGSIPALRALRATFHADVPLKPSAENTEIHLSYASGLATAQHSVQWSPTNLAELTDDSLRVRLNDSLLLACRDASGADMPQGAYIEVFAVDSFDTGLPDTAERQSYRSLSAPAGEGADPDALTAFLGTGLAEPLDAVEAVVHAYTDGTERPFANTDREYRTFDHLPSGSVRVDAFGLNAGEVASLQLRRQGNYRLRCTWRDASGTVIESLLALEVPKIELGGDLSATTGYARIWQPEALPYGAALQTDHSVLLNEQAGRAGQRTFSLFTHSAETAGLLARTEEGGPVADQLQIHPLVNYSPHFGGGLKVLNTFTDGTRFVEFTIALGGDLGDDFRIVLQAFKAGVTFADGTLERVVTADDLDELGRYRYRMLIPADVPGSACHFYQFHQGDQPVNRKI